MSPSGVLNIASSSDRLKERDEGRVLNMTVALHDNNNEFDEAEKQAISAEICPPPFSSTVVAILVTRSNSFESPVHSRFQKCARTCPLGRIPSLRIRLHGLFLWHGPSKFHDWPARAITHLVRPEVLEPNSFCNDAWSSDNAMLPWSTPAKRHRASSIHCWVIDSGPTTAGLPPQTSHCHPGQIPAAGVQPAGERNV